MCRQIPHGGGLVQAETFIGSCLKGMLRCGWCHWAKVPWVEGLWMLGHQHMLPWSHGFTHSCALAGCNSSMPAFQTLPSTRIVNTQGPSYCTPWKLACIVWTASLVDPKPTPAPPLFLSGALAWLSSIRIAACGLACMGRGRTPTSGQSADS